MAVLHERALAVIALLSQRVVSIVLAMFEDFGLEIPEAFVLASTTMLFGRRGLHLLHLHVGTRTRIFLRELLWRRPDPLSCCRP
jgi:hypothetical protein